MKTKEEIEQLAEKSIPLSNENIDYIEFANHDRKQWVNGYAQCQEDISNSWSKGCECKDSIGQTWCCNQCGLPYDTRKSDKKYTEEDMFKCWEACRRFERPISEGYAPNFNEFINSLNKQD